MHAGRGRGKRLLYWFRTPPGVRVGRSPIDETAIRLLEEHNPDVQFDWTRILKAPAPAEGQGRRDGRDNRDRDQRGRRETRSPQRSRSGGPPPAGPPPRPLGRQEPAAPPAADVTPPVVEDETPIEPMAAGAEAEISEQGEVSDRGDTRSRAPDLLPSRESGVELGDADQLEGSSAIEDVRQPEAFEARPEGAGTASYQRLGAEGLVRLRARYAEVMARIAERPLEEDAREELKQRAERLNPDGWVTADEVTAALEQYETVFEGLRGIVGRHPRHRRRR